MSKVKKKINTHLKAAQRWLGQAEKSFEDDCDLRGELDLMLAQAEFQHINELRSTNNRNYKKRFYLAVASITIFLSVFSHTKLIVDGDFKKNVVITPKVIEEPVVEAKVKTELNEIVSVENKESLRKDRQEVVSVQVSPVNQSVKTIKKDEANLLNSQELQKLMREAGQSLRGEDVKRSE